MNDNEQMGGKELQLKSHIKDWQMTSLLLRVLVRNGDTSRGRGNHLENGGKTTFCLNTVRNMPI